jgi:hypothetical protein
MHYVFDKPPDEPAGKRQSQKKKKGMMVKGLKIQTYTEHCKT